MVPSPKIPCVSAGGCVRSFGRLCFSLLSRVSATCLGIHRVDVAALMCVFATMRAPPLLLPGSRVALIAPAGPLRDEGDLERAVQSARAMGWEPVVGTHVLEREG